MVDSLSVAGKGGAFEHKKRRGGSRSAPLITGAVVALGTESKMHGRGLNGSLAKTGRAWALLCACLLLTVFAGLRVKQGIESDAVRHFALICDQVTLKIKERLDAAAWTRAGATMDTLLDAPATLLHNNKQGDA